MLMSQTLDRSPESAARARRTYAQNRRVRAALRDGELSIAVAMREQPAGLADRTLFEILLIAQRFGRARLRKLNARAIKDDVNLAVTLEAADERVRDWVATNALPHGRLAPRDVWAQLMAD
jgi:hypothetical protein